jgi:hypothetical protein
VGNLQEKIMMQKLGASNDDGDGKPPMIASHQKTKKTPNLKKAMVIVDPYFS